MEQKKEINVLGFGLMGRQIAALFSCLGFSVNVWTPNLDDLKRKRFGVERKLVERAYLQNISLKSEGEKGAPNIEYYQEINALPVAPTIEALIEDLDLKRNCIGQLRFASNEAPIFTNSSSIPPADLGSLVGALHFFNPITAVKVVELYLPNNFEAYSAQVSPILQSLESIGYSIVSVQNNIGLIGNFMLFSYVADFLFLLETKNYQAREIKTIMNGLSFNVNPLDVIDLVGVDVVRDIILNLKKEKPGIYLPRCLDEAIDQGILGKKNRTSFSDFLQSR